MKSKVKGPKVGKNYRGNGICGCFKFISLPRMYIIIALCYAIVSLLCWRHVLEDHSSYLRQRGETFNLFSSKSDRLLSLRGIKWMSFSGDVADRYDFPHSIYKEGYESWDNIIHPNSEIISSSLADKSNLSYMRVPKFWDPLEPYKVGESGIRQHLGQNGQRLMSRKEALSVGTYVKSDEGKDDLESIFVMVASFRDFQCLETVESIFSRAKHPQRIRVGIVDQIMKEENDIPCKNFCSNTATVVSCKYDLQIDTLTMDAAQAVGPVFARHIGNRMYRGEYFVLQSDAHVDFVQDWDDSIIKQWKSAKNEMAVISVYLSDVTNAIDPVTHKSNRPSRPIMCQTGFEGSYNSKHLRHGQQPEGVPLLTNQPMLEPFWAAGFSFARGHFMINVPYDQHLPMMFQGEEINIAVRAFTYGYDFYTPSEQVCFHYYASSEAGKKKKRDTVPMFWALSIEHKNRIEIKTLQRSNQIIESRLLYNKSREQKKKDIVDYQKYGIGMVRSPDLFYDLYGINRIDETVAKGLCFFAGKNMHYVYLQHLRDDQMGIDFTEMTYRFKDIDLSPNSWKSHVPPMTFERFRERLTEILASKGNGI